MGSSASAGVFSEAQVVALAGRERHCIAAKAVKSVHEFQLL